MANRTYVTKRWRRTDFWKIFQKEPSNSLPNLVLKDKAVLSWVQKKVLMSNVFNFFTLNELKFSQTRFLRFGKKRFPPKLRRSSQVSSWQEHFCQSYKSWSESNGAVAGIYKAASSQKVLKHITYTRLHSLVLSHTLLIQILIQIRNLRAQAWKSHAGAHSLGPFPHLSWWEPSGTCDWDVGFAGDSGLKECRCLVPKPSWRGFAAH